MVLVPPSATTDPSDSAPEVKAVTTAAGAVPPPLTVTDGEPTTDAVNVLPASRSVTVNVP
ncbi:hypothetical protein [Bradyrhizobium sp. 6(2017)]|uniref:hypothetical protein n=1 Tax=Bradyrhizobium sp. 6(2017) TaxID=1197460 RepID=UPI0004130D19